MNTVSFHTLGCKLNFAESGGLARQFSGRQYRVVAFGERADVTVINTCSVTEEADRKCRQAIRRAIRANPETFVVVTGCYAQLEPEEVAAIPGVDAVLGSREKLRLFDHIESFRKGGPGRIAVSCMDEHPPFHAAYAAGERTRAFLKIQDGCDYVCSFCTIPKARGQSRSASIHEVLRQAQEIADAGFREIVLTGVNIGLFGQDTGESIVDLLRRLDEVERVDRYRISSIEPNLLTDEIIDFVAGSKRFMPHFHIPLQSGDNDILGKMKRRYRSGKYADRIRKIKNAMPHAAIGADVIVGFPGESDQHFEITFEFLHALPVSYLHAFTYSERPGTAAVDPGFATDGDVVAKKERISRNRRLRQLSERKKKEFYRGHVGTKRPVLWEHSKKSGLQTGFTDNYIRVEQPHDARSSGQVELVELLDLSESGAVRAASRDFIPIA